MKHTVVVAGTFVKGAEWCRRRGLSLDDGRITIACSEEALLGVSPTRDCELELVELREWWLDLEAGVAAAMRARLRTLRGRETRSRLGMTVGPSMHVGMRRGGGVVGVWVLLAAAGVAVVAGLALKGCGSESWGECMEDGQPLAVIGGEGSWMLGDAALGGDGGIRYVWRRPGTRTGVEYYVKGKTLVAQWPVSWDDGVGGWVKRGGVGLATDDPVVDGGAFSSGATPLQPDR